MNTTLMHADDGVEEVADVSPAIHLSTTYEYPKDHARLVPAKDIVPKDAKTGDQDGDFYVYSRINIATVDRLEAIFQEILGAPSCVYGSGLSACHALMTHINPKNIFIQKADIGGYHGTLGICDILKRNYGIHVHDLEDASTATSQQLGEGDLIWLETPLNPTGEALSIQYYADVAHKAGAKLVVDSTFAPPPIQDPFKQGADYVTHSATKYFGGHSDVLAGVSACRDVTEVLAMRHDRSYIGTIPNGHNAWLLLRSLRTFNLRIKQQTKTAEELVSRLDALKSDKITKITHSSIQNDTFVKTQMPGGHSPTFSMVMASQDLAKAFPGKLRYFHHATSLGGVESLIEWRAMSDVHCNPRLLRVSVGVEDIDDLYRDMVSALESL